jgi:hypothetical protein
LNFLQRNTGNVSNIELLKRLEQSIDVSKLHHDNQPLANYVKQQIAAYAAIHFEEEKSDFATRVAEAKTEYVGLRTESSADIDRDLATMHPADIGALVSRLLHYAESHLRSKKNAPAKRLDNMRTLAERIVAHQQQTRGRYYRMALAALARLNEVKKKWGPAGRWTKDKE